jgi:hypothetical protein
MITIANTIAIAIANPITIAISSAISLVRIRPRTNAHTYATIDGKQVLDSAGQSESEICSLQDRIVHLSCRILGYNCQLHNHE